MPLSSKTGPDEQPSSGPPQFGLRAVMWGMLPIAMSLAYLRQLDSPTVFLEWGIVLVTAGVVGSVAGWCVRRPADAMYWSLVVATAAFLSVAEDRVVGNVFRFAWSAVGIVAGTCCGMLPPRRLGWRALTGGLSATATMVVYTSFSVTYQYEDLFDLLCAPVIGALLGVLIEIVFWLERISGMARYVTASWLLCAVIAGNLLVHNVRT